jgi:hypothetical protein
MIKIRIHHLEFTLNGKVWTGDNQNIADVLNTQSAMRPYRYERRVESAIAKYIVEKNKDRGAEIIYDSEEGKPLPEQFGDFD